MKVRMLHPLGGHNAGDEIDVPDELAAVYIEVGYVEPVAAPTPAAPEGG